MAFQLPAGCPLPAPVPVPGIPPDTPPDLAAIARRFAVFSVKTYMAGYLLKSNQLLPDGRACPRQDWTAWYVEHVGPILMFWAINEDLGDHATDPATIAQLKSSSAPKYINIADADVHVAPGPVLALNTQGCNLFHLHAATADELAQWTASIRLAAFEFSKLHEQYTAALLVRAPFRAPAALAHSSSSTDKFASYVQVRYSGCNDWRKLWCVVQPAGAASTVTAGRTSMLLKRRSAMPAASASASILFYESKKAKKPALVMANVYQAYAVYPERPHLINLSMLCKLEGTLVLDPPAPPESPVTNPAFLLIMAAQPSDLASLLVGTCAAFRLYQVGAPKAPVGGIPVPPVPASRARR
ncbi:hypothetical protein AMAG_07366 [Allomyces macrogynus ATCC 38327]|uniref:Skg3/CAF120-like PH-like domain-containing protein n=1 Tax=Allomyces macrogynus (strain ATCC 38327) TaxID=578462 RepID=A0A0L0SI39_ALLM3|nr:hypothetical protein AMAG_07366 [Allomyces macrogynus ATCC 38327]|eukprot:KNE62119.1 hypothetical protein AMAG_07366 [Allomyces macrogynus ATCC 38327]